MRTKKLVAVFACLAFLALVMMPSMGLCAPPKPKVIVLGTHELGAHGYNMLALPTESMVKKYPEIKWRAIPSGVDLARSMMPRTGETATTIHTGGSVWMLQEGLYDYANLEWGPQAVREVFCPEHAGMGFFVRGNSDIKTGYDLKGKTVAIYPGSPTPTLINESFLAFFDLTWNDVKPQKESSPGAAYVAVRDRHLDTAFMGCSSNVAVEMASMPCGIRWLDMPASDKEGWKRVQKVVPVHMPKKVTTGPGMSEEDPAEICAMGYPEIMSYDHTDEATIYWITRALIETRPEWKQKHPSLRDDWTLEKHWNLWDAGIIPMHAGAIMYYKEIGMWTPEREKMNQERIQHQKELRAYWDEVVEEAVEKKIKSRQFPEYWLKKYNARFGK